MTRWRWPLPERFRCVPTKGPRSFGAVRKHDVHTGVDLLAEPVTEFFAVETGKLVAVVDFTGPEAGSPWWLPTEAIIVRGADGRCVLYGEVPPSAGLPRYGEDVVRGQYLGTIAQVRRDSLCTVLGIVPDSMLHLELWESERAVMACYVKAWACEPNDWPRGGSRPAGLLDPTQFLRDADWPEFET